MKLIRTPLFAVGALLIYTSAAPTRADDDVVAMGLYDSVDGVAMPHWTSRWWQWAASMERDRSPVVDRTGDLCAVGQQGDVWFLAGAYGVDRVIRYCTVPAGKHLFFPLLNLVQTTLPGYEANCERMQQRVSLRNADALKLWVEVDGIDLTEQAALRMASPGCFNLAARATRERGVSGLHLSATNGYWAMLAPLTAGEYNIRFGAQRTDDSVQADDPNAGVIQDVEYVLTVAPD